MVAELENHLKFYEWLHRQMAALLDGLPPDALNWRPLPGQADDEVTNSLAALVAHVTGSERYWVGEVAGGRPAHRDRASEFRVQAPGSPELAAGLESTLALLRDVLAGLSPSALDETVTLGDRTVTRRWAVVHGIEHAAMHLGHMQLTRQLWEARARG